MRKYDNPTAYDSSHIIRNGSREYWYPLIVTNVIEYSNNKIVADIGCGTGIYTKIASEFSDCIIGLDKSSDMIQYAKYKFRKLNFIVSDAHSIPLKTDSMDTVLGLGLFEYVKRGLVLTEMKRILKVGGCALIVCPNKLSALRMPYKIYCRLSGKDYFCDEPTYGEMKELFKHNDFKIKEFKMNDGLIWLPKFVDKLIGKRIYRLIRQVSGNYYPFSNLMLFVVEKNGQ